MKKLTDSQIAVLRRLAETGMFSDTLIRGRDPLASARILGRLGLATQTGLGFFSGERWQITNAGREMLKKVGAR